jgi:MFS family permease
MHKKRLISRAVLLLSLVSLFTDIASEMLYPVMPLYLKEIGFTVAAIGILEGIAEAVAGLSKGYFGTWSDNTGVRMPFVRWGYGLSAISKPMMAVFSYAWWVFLARTIDRTGKGLRTGARDAILSGEATPGTKATVFGFHRSMDTAGAMVGPSLALLFLYFYPAQYKSLFVWALVPGIVAIAITFLIKEKKSTAGKDKEFPSFKAFYQYWIKAPAPYKKLTGALLAFALFNSSDVLLLLRMKETGRSDNALIAVYIFYNAVYAILAYPIGVLADKTSLKKIFTAGLLFFTIVYAGMCVEGSTYWYLFLFFLYGIYAAATEGISKAWITKLVAKEKVATAVGTYTGFQSIAALLASTKAGLLWFYFGAMATFMSSAIFTLLVLIYIYFKTE